MSKPLIVSIPHQLGREEAKRRIRTGVENVQATYGTKLAVLENRWTGDRLDFRVTALAQSVGGTVDVSEDHVTLAVQLPWVLAVLADKAKRLIQAQGHLMLEKK